MFEYFFRKRVQKRLEKQLAAERMQNKHPVVSQYRNTKHAAQARKIKQFLEAGNIDEAYIRAEFFRNIGVKADTIQDCDRILEACK